VEFGHCLSLLEPRPSATTSEDVRLPVASGGQLIGMTKPHLHMAQCTLALAMAKSATDTENCSEPRPLATAAATFGAPSEGYGVCMPAGAASCAQVLSVCWLWSKDVGRLAADATWRLFIACLSAAHRLPCVSQKVFVCQQGPTYWHNKSHLQCIGVCSP